MESVHETRTSIIDCPICLEAVLIEDIFAQLVSCNHSLCLPCYNQLVNYSHNCPLCGLNFTGCEYMNNKNIVNQYVLTELQFENVKKNKNSNGIINLYKFNIYFSDANFDCFTKEELLRELKHYQKLLEKIKINLFVQRNSDGSRKEWRIFENLIDMLFICNNSLSRNLFDSKSVMGNLDSVITGIKDLQQRKYRDANFYESDEENLDLDIDSDYIDGSQIRIKEPKYESIMYSIEYMDRKKPCLKKKKKK